MRKLLFLLPLLMLVPQLAWAQDLNLRMALFALIPSVNILLALAYAIKSRSIKNFLFHIVLVAVWVIAFGIVSGMNTSTLVAWLPVYLSIAHSLYLLFRTTRKRKRR